METDMLQDGIVKAGTPEQVGIRSEYILNFLRRLREIEYDIHSLQIVKDDTLIFAGAAEPYTLDSAHRLLSAAKPIIGAAVLYAIEEGYFDFETKIYPFFQQELPEVCDERIREITVYDLMTMQTGQNSDDAFLDFLQNPEKDLCKSFFHTAMNCKPGTQFFYNNAVPHLLFTLVERATGKDIGEYIKQKIAEPLGMEITAQYNKNQVYDPVTTVVSAKGFLKFALWFLKKGKWKEKQLISPELMKMACTQQVWTGNDEPGYRNNKGYCMQIWANAFGGCRMDGGGGQVALILPEHDMVFVFMGNESRADLAVQIFYEEILSKMQGRALPELEAKWCLSKEAAKLMSRAPYQAVSHEYSIEKEKEQKYSFEENTWGISSVEMQFEEDLTRVTVVQNQENLSYEIGLNAKWKSSERPFLIQPDTSIQNMIYGSDPQCCFLSGGWKNESSYVIVDKSIASMGEYVFVLQFEEGKLRISIPNGISAGMKQGMDASWLESK